MDICVILPAAGLGQRFAPGTSPGSPPGTSPGNSPGNSSELSAAAFGLTHGGTSKIEFEIEGKPVFLHAIEAFRAVGDVGQIILAVHPDRLDDFRFRWEDKLAFLQVDLVAGGRVERWETVKLALGAVKDGATHIAVHDAARPVVSPKMIERVFATAQRLPAVIPGLAVSSTLKKTGAPPEDPTVSLASDPLDDILGSAPGTNPIAAARPVTETVPRDGLVAIQTPQVFAIDLMQRAYAQAENHPGVTDDAGLVEALGETVHVVDGDPGNLKITRPQDVELAAALIAHRKQAVAKKKVVDLFGDDDD